MFDVCCCACDEVKVLVVLIMVWKVSKIENEHRGDIIALRRGREHGNIFLKQNSILTWLSTQPQSQPASAVIIGKGKKIR